jgi:hypothetical protein
MAELWGAHVSLANEHIFIPHSLLEDGTDYACDLTTSIRRLIHAQRLFSWLLSEEVWVIV